MALTKTKVREILSDAGLDSTPANTATDAIMEGHLASINALREERDAAKAESERLSTENTRLNGDLQRAKAETEKLTAVQKELDELKAKYATAHKAEDDLAKVNEELATLKAEHETAKSAVADLTKIKEEYEAYKAEQDAKATTASKEEAFKAFLHDMNLSDKGITLAMKYTDMNAVELNDKGKISNAAALRKAVTDDWGDYITETVEEGVETANPPASNPTYAGKSAAEILAIEDDGELFKTIEANPGAFGLA